MVNRFQEYRSKKEGATFLERVSAVVRTIPTSVVLTEIRDFVFGEPWNQGNSEQGFQVGQYASDQDLIKGVEQAGIRNYESLQRWRQYQRYNESIYSLRDESIFIDLLLSVADPISLKSFGFAAKITKAIAIANRGMIQASRSRRIIEGGLVVSAGSGAEALVSGSIKGIFGDPRYDPQTIALETGLGIVLGGTLGGLTGAIPIKTPIGNPVRYSLKNRTPEQVKNLQQDISGRGLVSILKEIDIFTNIRIDKNRIDAQLKFTSPQDSDNLIGITFSIKELMDADDIVSLFGNLTRNGKFYRDRATGKVWIESTNNGRTTSLGKGNFRNGSKIYVQQQPPETLTINAIENTDLSRDSYRFFHGTRPLNRPPENTTLYDGFLIGNSPIRVAKRSKDLTDRIYTKFNNRYDRTAQIITWGRGGDFKNLEEIQRAIENHHSVNYQVRTKSGNVISLVGASIQLPNGRYYVSLPDEQEILKGVGYITTATRKTGRGDDIAQGGISFITDRDDLLPNGSDIGINVSRLTKNKAMERGYKIIEDSITEMSRGELSFVRTGIPSPANDVGIGNTLGIVGRISRRQEELVELSDRFQKVSEDFNNKLVVLTEEEGARFVLTTPRERENVFLGIERSFSRAEREKIFDGILMNERALIRAGNVTPSISDDIFKELRLKANVIKSISENINKSIREKFKAISPLDSQQKMVNDMFTGIGPQTDEKYREILVASSRFNDAFITQRGNFIETEILLHGTNRVNDYIVRVLSSVYEGTFSGILGRASFTKDPRNDALRAISQQILSPQGDPTSRLLSFTVSSGIEQSQRLLNDIGLTRITPRIKNITNALDKLRVSPTKRDELKLILSQSGRKIREVPDVENAENILSDIGIIDTDGNLRKAIDGYINTVRTVHRSYNFLNQVIDTHTFVTNGSKVARELESNHFRNLIRVYERTQGRNVNNFGVFADEGISSGKRVNVLTTSLLDPVKYASVRERFLNWLRLNHKDDLLLIVDDDLEVSLLRSFYGHGEKGILKHSFGTESINEAETILSNIFRMNGTPQNQIDYLKMLLRLSSNSVYGSKDGLFSGNQKLQNLLKNITLITNITNLRNGGVYDVVDIVFQALTNYSVLVTQGLAPYYSRLQSRLSHSGNKKETASATNTMLRALTRIATEDTNPSNSLLSKGLSRGAQATQFFTGNAFTQTMQRELSTIGINETIYNATRIFKRGLSSGDITVRDITLKNKKFIEWYDRSTTQNLRDAFHATGMTGEQIVRFGNSIEEAYGKGLSVIRNLDFEELIKLSEVDIDSATFYATLIRRKGDQASLNPSLAERLPWFRPYQNRFFTQFISFMQSAHFNRLIKILNAENIGLVYPAIALASMLFTTTQDVLFELDGNKTYYAKKIQSSPDLFRSIHGLSDSALLGMVSYFLNPLLIQAQTGQFGIDRLLTIPTLETSKRVLTLPANALYNYNRRGASYAGTKILHDVSKLTPFINTIGGELTYNAIKEIGNLGSGE